MESAQESVTRLFDEAFGGSCGSSQLSRTDDVVEVLPEGLRLGYSSQTADWLAAVAEQPSHPRVYEYLDMLLHSAVSPLGHLGAAFHSLFEREFGGKECTSSSPGMCTEPSSAAATMGRVQQAVVCCACAVKRLHAITLDIFPPLKHADALQSSLSAIESFVYTGAGLRLREMLHSVHWAEDAECDAALLESGAHVLPRDFGSSPLFWLSTDEQCTDQEAAPKAAIAGEAAIADEAATADNGFAAAAEPPHNPQYDEHDNSAPYASVVTRLRALPLHAAPRGKLALFCEACSEASQCVWRHHRLSSPHRLSESCGSDGAQISGCDDGCGWPREAPPDASAPEASSPSGLRENISIRKDQLRKKVGQKIGRHLPRGKGRLSRRRCRAVAEAGTVEALAVGAPTQAVVSTPEVVSTPVAASARDSDALSRVNGPTISDAPSRSPAQSRGPKILFALNAEELIPVMAYVLSRAQVCVVCARDPLRASPPPPPLRLPRLLVRRRRLYTRLFAPALLLRWTVV